MVYGAAMLFAAISRSFDFVAISKCKQIALGFSVTVHVREIYIASICSCSLNTVNLVPPKS